jgi:4-amino-4-deoxy-L-arabinose transferase-like glycosyltransferase
MWRQGLHICAHHAAAVGLVTFASFVLMAVNPYDSGLYHLLGDKRNKTGSLKNRYAEALGAPSVAALTLLNGLLLVFTWAGVGLYLWRLAHQKDRHDANLLLYPLLLALALMALSAGPVEAIQMRFRLPATAFLAVIAAVGWFGSSRDHLAGGGTRQKPLS